jgi:lipopolysaccharide transport system permease protein
LAAEVRADLRVVPSTAWRLLAVPYALYVLAGTLLWQLFVDTLTAPLQRLSAARSVLTKARVPHETWIAAGALDAGVSFFIRLGMLAVAMALAGTSGGWDLLLAPLGALTLMVLGPAIGLALTPVGLLYPDVERGLSIVIGLSFFLTPVIYPPPGTFLIRLTQPHLVIHL